MKHVLLVHKNRRFVELAILEDGQLVELHREPLQKPFGVGDIFLARVKKVMSALNAAFIDVGYERDGFLHYFDLGPQIRSQQKFLRLILDSGQYIPLESFRAENDIHKEGNIKEVLRPHEPLLVQIMKEPISTKGPRLSSQLTFAGNYVVFIPFGKGVAVSRKFKDYERRQYLKKVLEGWIPPNMGMIVRTAAENISIEQIKEEFLKLKTTWESMIQQLLQQRKAAIPRKIFNEQSKVATLIRDTLSIGFDEILVDTPALYEEIKSYMAENHPDQIKKVRLVQSRQGLFHDKHIYRQIKQQFGKIVPLSNGSYLVIEHTEAANIIDVNSGSQRVKEGDPEQMALEINLEAAKEIARQLRLRDLGGIIIVDFIDQKLPENRKKVADALKAALEKDRAKTTVLPMSKFGIVQITRQRSRPALKMTTEETCPCCEGKGKIQSPLAILPRIEKDLLQYRERIIPLYAHPFVISYLKTTGFQWRWLWQHKQWVQLKSREDFPLLHYHIGKHPPEAHEIMA